MSAIRLAMRRTRFAGCYLAGLLALGIMLSPSTGEAKSCTHRDGGTFRDVRWRQAKNSVHPLVGQVLRGDKPIFGQIGLCNSPLQKLIAEVWGTIEAGGIVLLGEVHDNPEHHAVRGNILWPRLDGLVQTKATHPAAVFEHIRTGQKAQLDYFYQVAARSRRLWRAPDLLRVLEWKASGWPEARIFYPLFDAALQGKLPILPGNAERVRVRALVRGEGHVPASAEEAEHLRLARAMPQPLVHELERELAGSHCGILPANAIPAMGLAQRYTDAHMAVALANASQRHTAAFLLAGNGHLRSDRGVPWYLRQFAPRRKVLSVMLLEVAEGHNDPGEYVPRGPGSEPVADYVLLTPRHPRPDPCEAMRRGKP